MYRWMQKVFTHGQRGSASNITIGVIGLVFILLVVPVFITGMYTATIDQAIAWWTARGYVAIASPTGELTVSGKILPDADNTRDVGSVAKSWKDGHFDGTVTAPTFAGNATTA